MENLVTFEQAQAFLYNGTRYRSPLDKPLFLRDDQLRIENPAATFEYTITGAALTADRVLTLPLITAADTLAALGLAQTFTALQTFQKASAAAVLIDRTTSHGEAFRIAYAGSGQIVFETSNTSPKISTVNNLALTVKPGDSGTTVAGQDLTLQGGKAGTTGAGNTGGGVVITSGDASGTGNNNGGAVKLTPGAKTGTGLKRLVELDASGDVPTAAVLGEDYVAFKYNPAGTLVAYVVDGGAVKSVSLGTPA